MRHGVCVWNIPGLECEKEYVKNYGVATQNFSTTDYFNM